MKPSAPFLLIGVPLAAIPLWYASGQLGLSKLHPFDKTLNGLEHKFLNNFVFSLCLLAFVGVVTLRATLRLETPRLDFLIGVCAGIAILLFFQRFATFTVQAINAVLVRNAASAANIGQLRDTANDLRLLFASTLLGYIFWRARHVLSGGSKRPTACTDTCRPTLPQP